MVTGACAVCVRFAVYGFLSCYWCRNGVMGFRELIEVARQTRYVSFHSFRQGTSAEHGKRYINASAVAKPTVDMKIAKYTPDFCSHNAQLPDSY